VKSVILWFNLLLVLCQPLTASGNSNFEVLADEARKTTTAWLKSSGLPYLFESPLKAEIYWYYEEDVRSREIGSDYGYHIYIDIPEKGRLVFRSLDKKSLLPGFGRAIPSNDEISRRYRIQAKPYLDFTPGMLLVSWKKEAEFSEVIGFLTKLVGGTAPDLHQVTWNNGSKSFFWANLPAFKEIDFLDKISSSDLLESVLVNYVPLKIHPGKKPRFDLVYSGN